jgi:hypothetical protein
MSAEARENFFYAIERTRATRNIRHTINSVN